MQYVSLGMGTPIQPKELRPSKPKYRNTITQTKKQTNKHTYIQTIQAIESDGETIYEI